MSRRLILLRHTKSDWPDGIADHERPLGRRGLADAPRIGSYIETHGLIPDFAVVSTARRTRETWDLVEQEFSRSVPTRFDRRIYEAKPGALLYVARETEPSVGTLLLVGHNPGFEDLARFLIGSGSEEARERLAQKYPTGGLAVIDFDIGDWRDIETRSGSLNRFVTPRSLADEED
ncbi:phosphohistidine phosphatase [Pseudochelatococcus lubricantis]|uniref:Phosphohistidine phosphatase n=1 Tax=Pseudochelatococcus lubricantis TaxID=1538102 RepID=A0ABX0UYC9_9HYPH|nr:histidine phosphatase family protein [Pseudochelatococcus lubricantis]NIJ57956.1 phosphohistidine phosphatase [Pseudochelatococcus lubricantis]